MLQNQTEVARDSRDSTLFYTSSTRSSKTLVEKLVESRGGRVLFTPKFHPEFQPVECVYRDVSKEIRRKNVPGVSAGMNKILR